ncbi:hypothetical protein [Mycolicibacterium pyrenivorans]|uniref:hypothetical protein n=1 Tax=Mycolicibacterium pyrenivorans TaxID=187102 RepID=UPI000B023F43|nr:hypothetical protein [Mycolicibacterium pyrenivorans]MCV7150684.1 hypothetical protein [Mycolicibacterium pyrenivorans]
MDALEHAVRDAAEFGAPPKTFHVGPDAAVNFGTGPNPFDHMQVTAWVDSFDTADVAAGRSE